MKNYPAHVKHSLETVIKNMVEHPDNFCKHPGKDFTRNRKLPLDKVLLLLVKMGAHSLRDEMLDCLDIDDAPATVSALVQQRSKILPSALEYLFHEFTRMCERPARFKGYRLLAVDAQYYGQRKWNDWNTESVKTLGIYGALLSVLYWPVGLILLALDVVLICFSFVPYWQINKAYVTGNMGPMVETINVIGKLAAKFAVWFFRFIIEVYKLIFRLIWALVKGIF